MKAAIYQGAQDVVVEDRPVPTPSAGEVLLRVHETGICGSDMQIYAGTHPRAKAPFTPGHEIFGMVESLGEGVTGVKKGDRVAVYPLISCGHCDPCRSGNAHVCEHLKLVGIDRDGGFAEFVAVGAHQLVPVPDAISNSEAVIIEPLAVAVHAVCDSRFRLGDTVLVTGGGPIGNLIAQTVRASGARQVVVSEVSDFRRRLLEGLGFDSFNPLQDDAADVLQHVTGKSTVDIVFEATGLAAAYEDALRCCQVRGHVSFVGIPKVTPPIDVQKMVYKEIHTSSARVYRHRDYAAAIALLVAKSVQAKPLITDRVPLSATPRAYELMKKADASGKIVIAPELL